MLSGRAHLRRCSHTQRSLGLRRRRRRQTDEEIMTHRIHIAVNFKCNHIGWNEDDVAVFGAL